MSQWMNRTAIAMLIFTSCPAIAGGVKQCGVGEPCQFSYQNGRDVVFEFGNSGEDFDLYNIRYSTRNGTKQVENRSGTFTVHNTRSGASYEISVQGCRKRFLQSSVCSAWVHISHRAT